MQPSPQVIEVWGDLACFTRPELKVERFSYPVVTPSAARAIFEAIYWKRPKFRWQVTKIEVLAEPQYIALRRNEVKGKAPDASTILRWALGDAEPRPLWADSDDVESGRTQRQTMALKNVHYRLTAEVRPWPEHVQDLVGLESCFRRRARHGQCVYQPYLGCREFPAYFRLVEGRPAGPPPAAVDIDVGLMLYDVFDLSKPGTSEDRPSVSLFRANVAGGVLRIPDFSDSAVLKDTREGR